MTLTWSSRHDRVKPEKVSPYKAKSLTSGYLPQSMRITACSCPGLKDENPKPFSVSRTSSGVSER